MISRKIKKIIACCVVVTFMVTTITTTVLINGNNNNTNEASKNMITVQEIRSNDDEIMDEIANAYFRKIFIKNEEIVPRDFKEYFKDYMFENHIDILDFCIYIFVIDDFYRTKRKALDDERLVQDVKLIIYLKNPYTIIKNDDVNVPVYIALDDSVYGVDIRYIYIQYGTNILIHLRQMQPRKEGYKFIAWLLNGEIVTYDVLMPRGNNNVISILFQRIAVDSGLEYDTNLRFQLNSYGTYTIIGQIQWQSGSELILPTFNNGVRVTHIAADAFSQRNFQNVILPRYIEVIGDRAFMGLNSYEMILSNLPNLRTIGLHAFKYSTMRSLTLENLPSLTIIGAQSFRHNRLTQVVFRNLPQLTKMYNGIFYNNEGLRTITFENVNPTLTFENTIFSRWINNIMVTLIGSERPSWWDNRDIIFNLNARFIKSLGNSVTL